MQKTGLKTFVYSFSVSLFAIFAANGVYLHTKSSAEEPLRISGKNVALFLRDSATNPSYSAAPTKKIALNKLPEITPKTVDDVIFADEIDIPLSFEEDSAISYTKAPNVEPEIVYADATIVASKHIPPKNIEPAGIYASSNSEHDKIAIPQKAPLIESNIIASKEPALKTPPQKADREIVVAHNDSSVYADHVSIPLERGAITNEDIIMLDSKQRAPEKQIALADANIPLKSIQNNQNTGDTPLLVQKDNQWESMADIHSEASSPWVAAKAKGANRNQKIYEQEHYKTEVGDISNTLSNQIPNKKGVKIASETVQNILIPIPDDIMQDKNLTPKLSFDPSNKDTDQEKTKLPAAENAPLAEKTADEISKNKILSSLGSLFSASAKSVKKLTTPAKKTDILADISKKFIKSQLSGKIMPTEMRLSFQPNRAEISGQTLRWVQAFASKATENDSTALEIRIDGTNSTMLQQKRLNLLYNILTNKGVSYSKINTVFTQREPNSFIIRIMANNDPEKNISSNKAKNSYYQEW